MVSRKLQCNILYHRKLDETSSGESGTATKKKKKDVKKALNDFSSW
jgi:hypothetical protein